MSKIKVGIIGCGGIANQKHLPALSRRSDVEIVAFCDIIEERAVKAAKEYGVPGALVCTDYKELIAIPEIETVHVLTPNVSHCELTCAALDAGKHVICEKPMAATPDDAKKMIEARDRSGKLLTIGYQNRYRQDSLTLKSICEAGGLGEIYYARAHAIRRRAVPTWGVFPNKALQGGGPLIDIGTHALDLTLWMMDNYKPKSVMGVSFEKLGRTLGKGEQGNAFGNWDPETYEVEDSAFGFITMENGAVIYLEAAWALNSLDIDEAKTSLSGTKAGADMRDGLRINHVVFDKLAVDKPECNAAGGVAFFEGGAGGRPEDIEADIFYKAVKGEGELVVKPEQAYVVTQILDAIYQSSKTGKAVYFD
ncbi:MAG: Gfo/Idh/MocA family oxidoreductase [Clostridiales bacterium]|nr:Gfo/Idh/MocA family oxidoreductase [Clostridiales bacterium]